VRVFTVSNRTGPFLSLLVGADDTIVGVSRPWTTEPGQLVERLELVRERQQVGAVTLPRIIEWRVGKHVAEVVTTAATGEPALRDFR